MNHTAYLNLTFDVSGSSPAFVRARIQSETPVALTRDFSKQEMIVCALHMDGKSFDEAIKNVLQMVKHEHDPFKLKWLLPHLTAYTFI